MSVLDRSALADSPLADLHAIASELGVDGFRRLRRDDLIDAILARQDGEEPAAQEAAEEEETTARPRRRRGGRSRGARDVDEAEREAPRRALGRGAAEAEEDEDEAPRRAPRGRARRDEDEAPAPAERRRGRGVREPRAAAETRDEDRVVEGVVELLPNGSAFVRVSPPDASDEDAYLSAGQVRRCELVSGDRVGGPVRPPRRSERHPSLVRVETINGRPADQVSDGVRFDELPAAFPSDRLALDSDDPVVQAIDFIAPIGRGSRVTIAGPPRSGKSEALRRLAAALAGIDGLERSLVLVGVRPEELAEAAQGPIEPEAALSFATSPDAQAKAVEGAIEQGKRVAARGGDAVVLIDTLDGLPPAVARRSLAAARNLAEHGSLTVIATAAKPLGGETTVVALDAELAGSGRFPAIDLLATGTLRPELLVGEDGAAAIAEALAEALA
jgi:transcription termination factor Rho